MHKLLATLTALTLLAACQTSGGRNIAAMSPTQLQAAKAQDAETAKVAIARCDQASATIVDSTKCKAAARERYITPYASPEEQRISRILVAQNIALAEKIQRGELTEAQARDQYAAIVRSVMDQERRQHQSRSRRS